MASGKTNFAFPFRVTAAGNISSSPGADAVRNKIIQILFTAPGERVNQPEFGCGLFNLVFEPNDAVLAAAVEYSIGQALTRWLSDEIVVDGVNAEHLDEKILIEVAYTVKKNLKRSAVRISFK